MQCDSALCCLAGVVVPLLSQSSPSQQDYEHKRKSIISGDSDEHTPAAHEQDDENLYDWGSCYDRRLWSGSSYISGNVGNASMALAKKVNFNIEQTCGFGF